MSVKITDIPLSELEAFLRLNRVKPPRSDADIYQSAWDLILSGEANYPANIVEWMMAYEVDRKKTKIPGYSRAEIHNLSKDDLRKLANLLDMRTTDVNHMIGIMYYLHKLHEPTNNKICDEISVRRAIEKYGEYVGFNRLKLFNMPISQLSKEFGNNAFNVELLNQMWDNLALTRYGFEDIHLGPIIFNALNNYKYHEQQANMPPGELEKRYGDSYWRPNWNPSWSYLNCLLEIFQSDPRTHTNTPDVSDEEDEEYED